MELSIEDRIRLMEILPQQGSFDTLKTVRQLRERLSFDEDGEELGLKVGPHIWEDPRDERETDTDYASRMALPHEEGLVCWRDSAAPIREIDLNPRMVKLIAETLTKLSETGQLKESQMSLYERFVCPED